MKIELYGRCGSGKTTFFRNSKIQRIEVKGFSKFYWAFRYFIKYPILCFKLNRLVNASTNTITNNRLKLWYYKNMNLLNTIAKEEKANQYLDDVLIDEGFFSLLNDILDIKIDKEIVYEVLDILPKPDKIIFLDCKNGEVKNKRQELGEEYFNNWCEAIENNIRIVLNYIKETKCCEIEVIKMIKKVEVDVEIE